MTRTSRLIAICLVSVIASAVSLAQVPARAAAGAADRSPRPPAPSSTPVSGGFGVSEATGGHSVPISGSRNNAVGQTLTVICDPSDVRGVCKGPIAQCGDAAVLLLAANSNSALLQVSCGRPKYRDTGQRVAEAAYARVVRLLPVPRIGVAPADGVTLVNIDTVLWVATGVGVDLGSAVLLGQRVGLRARLTGVAWRFGDGFSASSDGPGKVYSERDPCRSRRCPDYFAHVYGRTGRFRVTATLTWAGQFRVGNGEWQDIPQSVSVASPATVVQVKQARAVLVPNK